VFPHRFLSLLLHICNWTFGMGKKCQGAREFGMEVWGTRLRWYGLSVQYMTSPTDTSVICLLIHHCTSACAHQTHDCVDMGILFFTFWLILSVSFSPCQASCHPVRSPFPHLTPFWPCNSHYDAQAHDILHFGCISLVFKCHLWRRLFRSYRSWQGFPHKLIHYIYIFN